jgi:hypothetical protein
VHTSLNMLTATATPAASERPIPAPNCYACRCIETMWFHKGLCVIPHTRYVAISISTVRSIFYPQHRFSEIALWAHHGPPSRLRSMKLFVDLDLAPEGHSKERKVIMTRLFIPLLPVILLCFLRAARMEAPSEVSEYFSTFICFGNDSLACCVQRRLKLRPHSTSPDLSLLSQSACYLVERR